MFSWLAPLAGWHLIFRGIRTNGMNMHVQSRIRTWSNCFSPFDSNLAASHGYYLYLFVLCAPARSRGQLASPSNLRSHLLLCCLCLHFTKLRWWWCTSVFSESSLSCLVGFFGYFNPCRWLWLALTKSWAYVGRRRTPGIFYLFTGPALDKQSPTITNNHHQMLSYHCD